MINASEEVATFGSCMRGRGTVGRPSPPESAAARARSSRPKHRLLASPMISTPQMRRDAEDFADMVDALVRSPLAVRDANPKVFMDIGIGGIFFGRLVIELRSDIAPRTAENFRQLCTGEGGMMRSGHPLCYKGNHFFCIIPDYLCQAGDLGAPDGGQSIYGPTFADENFTLKHSRAGIVSMASSGPNTNASQFFITCVRRRDLDGRHVAFGEVIRGLDVLELVEAAGSPSGRPRNTVRILTCGQL